MFRHIIGLILVASAWSALAKDVVLPPNSTFGGLTDAQLTAEWWQWAMSAPDELNPVADETGVNCAVGQQGPVWFLAGGFGSSQLHRLCTIPAGKALFFPIINMVYYPARGNRTYTCEEAKASAAVNNEAALDLFAELDGCSISNLKQHRIASKECFDVFARVPFRQRSYKTFPSATDGYWLLLEPLAPGRHTLKFGGRYSKNSSAYGRMIQDIEYELIVQ